jgi:hypothetical protein
MYASEFVKCVHSFVISHVFRLIPAYRAYCRVCGLVPGLRLLNLAVVRYFNFYWWAGKVGLKPVNLVFLCRREFWELSVGASLP